MTDDIVVPTRSTHLPLLAKMAGILQGGRDCRRGCRTVLGAITAATLFHNHLLYKGCNGWWDGQTMMLKGVAPGSGGSIGRRRD